MACGLVVDDQQLDHGPEWRSFQGEESNPSRVGPPRSRAFHDRGLSTTIGGEDGDRVALSDRKQQRLRRQRRLQVQAQTRSKRERTQRAGFTEIKRIASQLDLAAWLVEQACSLFESIQKADLLVGRSIEAGAAAAVFIACRMSEQHRSPSVGQHARCSMDQVWGMYRVVVRELELPVPVQRPVEFIPEIVTNLDRPVPARMRTAAEQVAREAADHDAVQGKPSGIAAACLYAVGRRQAWPRVTQQALAEAADVAPVTVRNHWHVLRERLEADVAPASTAR